MTGAQMGDEDWIDPSDESITSLDNPVSELSWRNFVRTSASTKSQALKIDRCADFAVRAASSKAS